MSHSPVIHLCICIAILFLQGCPGQHGPKRATISGFVTLNGEPLKNGTVLLKPADQEPNPMSSAEIHDGKFLINNQGGAAVGTFNVQILAYRSETTIEDGEQFEQRIQFLPPEYNKSTKLTLTVPDGPDLVEAQFDLKADPNKSYP